MPTNKTVPATCHPEKLHMARGLCSACYKRALRKKDPTKAREYSRDHRTRNPELYRGYRVKSVYGLTREEYESLLAKQDGRCAICGERPAKPLHVDHNHETGEVRGLLCGGCNVGLGMFADDPARLVGASIYLTEGGRLEELEGIRPEHLRPELAEVPGGAA